MIIKILKGRSFSGLLDYLFNPQDKPPPTEIEARSSTKEQSLNEEPALRAEPSSERPMDDSTEGRQSGGQVEAGKAKHEQRGELLITNMAGHSKEELLEHFEALAALRPDVEVNVLHGIISMPEEDVLARATKARIVMRFVELKGLDRTMYAAVEHKEEGHKHTEIHIASSTIDFKGRLPSDSFDYDKGEAIARQLEKEFDLKPNRSSRDAMERAPTQGEWKQHERTGKLSRPLRLQALVNAALEREVAFTEFQERLDRRGVALRLLVNDEGKVVGSVYEFEGRHIRGRRLGRGYTWPGLQRNWPEQQERKGRMTYEPERDHAAFSRSRSSAMGRGGADESREPERPVGAISGDESANERTGREAGAHREPSRQTSAIGEEGRGAVRDNRTRGKGTTRRDGRAPEEYSDKSRPVQRAGDDDGGTDQGRVPAPAQNSRTVLRRNAKDKRQERADGGAMSGDGSDEQRRISQGQRRRTGGVGENAGTSEGRGRDASQGNRGAGATLSDDLQAAEQVDHHWDDSDSPVRVRSWHGGQRAVDSVEVISTRRNETLDLRDVGEAKKHGDVHSRIAPDALSTDSESKAHHPSAVDAVIKTLWRDSSACEGMVYQSTTGLNQKGRAKEIEDYPKQPDMTTPAETAKRAESSLKPRAPLETGKDQADSLRSQRPSQERQEDRAERGRSGRHGPSR
jgi:Relaxase/Mobilisation nuclease domain